ncbi:MAG: cardiolipin synthase [Acidobacteria bacterium]|nr:cardiolipin synthase [Acidobacteriota bacterium]MCA1609937.1 cardiolipin synthase [Acidobacteriota bacterium]
MRRFPASPVLLLLVCGFSSSGCTFINNIVGSEKRDVYKFDHPFTVDDPSFRRSMDTLGTAMVGGNEAELLKNGDEIFPAMTRDIRAAKKTVNLETYIFQPDRAGRQFADAMIDAAKRGVEVRFLIDAWGSKLKGLEAELKKAGVHVRKYRPVRLFTIYKVSRRTHRKILVVDGRIAYTGGLGIDERWLGNARNTNEWRDTQVRVVGPVVAQMQAIFSEDWTYTTGEILAGEGFYPKLENAASIQAQAIKSSRGDSSSLAKMLYYVAIQSAAKSIYIQNAYFLPDKQVREALVAAEQRGVNVQVMVPGRHIDLPMVRFASWLHYGELLKGGVKIYEYRGTMMHNKTMVVDGLYSTIGSINFDSRSMSRNAEESLAFYDRGFARKMEAMFEEDRKRCQEITYQAWDKRGLVQRLAELVFWVWEPYY